MSITIIEQHPLVKSSLREPRKWLVIILNDDFTPTDFVTQLLINHFNKSVVEAITITNEIHSKGRAIVGMYPYEVAETKLSMVSLASRQAKLPLRAIIEPEQAS